MLSASNRKKLGSDNPTYQTVGLETALSYQNTIVRVLVNADAKTAAFNFTMPVSMYIADVVVQAQAAATDGTLVMRRGTDEITDTIACATDHTFDRAATIDNARAQTTAGETLNFLAAGTGAGEGEKARAIVYIYGSPV